MAKASEIITVRMEEARRSLQSGDLAAGVAHLQEVLRRDRRHVPALRLLVEVYNVRGDFDQAAQFMARIVQAEPKDARHRVGLAQLYAAAGRYPKAHDQFDHALKLAPGYSWARGGKAAVFERQDRSADALRLLRGAAPDPMPPELASVYVRVLARGGEVEEAIRVGRSAVDAGAPADALLRDTWFALARAYERHGDYDEAFAAATAGNAMLRVPYDPDAITRFVDAQIATFTPERIAEYARATDSSEQPVFIVGMPRTGSTLIERIVHAHPLAFGADEHAAMYAIVEGLPQRIGTETPYPACVAEMEERHATSAAREYLAVMRRLAPKAERVTNKDLANYRHLGLIQLLLPGVRVIHCRRDPVDTCLSCFMERLIPTAVPYACDLRHLGEHYREYQRLMDHWTAVLDIQRLDVTYEELIEDQQAVSRRIIEFLGLPWDENCMRFNEVERADRTLSYDQVRRPLYTSSVGRAIRFGTNLDPLREALSD